MNARADQGWRVKLHCGHTLDVLASMDEASVHAIITSPPYWGLRDYGLEPVEWPDGWTGCLGLEPTPEMYVEHLVTVFDAVKRVLRPDGTLWLNLGDSYAGTGRGGSGNRNRGNKGSVTAPGKSRLAASNIKPKDLIGIPWRVAFALQADGWYLRSDIVWAKKNPMPESVRDRCTRAHEFVFMLAHPESKGRYFYDHEAIKEPSTMKPQRRSKPHKRRVPGRGSTGMAPDTFSTTSARNEAAKDFKTRNKRDVWHLATQPFPEAHFAVFPEKLVEPMILAATSAEGVCAACGAPWVRLTEKETRQVESERNVGGREDGFTRMPWGASLEQTRPCATTIGWQPTCNCDAGVEPAVTLDPFGGAGTTALVSIVHGRRSIYIDQNPFFRGMTIRRLQEHLDE